MSIANRKKYGVRKMLNITMVFKCSFQFPVFFKLFSLKYAFTREFNVLKNFKLSLVENVGDVVFIFSIQNFFKCNYYNFFITDINHFLSTKTVFLLKIQIHGRNYQTIS